MIGTVLGNASSGSEGASASIFVTGLAQTDSVTMATPSGNILNGVWSSKPKPLPNGCIAEYLFNGNGSDSSGEGDNLTNYGVGFTNGEAIFNGSSYAETTRNTLVSGNPYTVSLWFKTTSNDTHYLFASSTAANYNIIKIYIASGKITVSSERPSVTIKSNKVLSDGSYHHVMLVMASGGAKLYVDGVLDVSASMSSNITESSAIRLGANGMGTPQYWRYLDGSEKLVRIFESALTPADCVQLYHEGIGIIDTVDGFLFDDLDAYGNYTITASNGTKTKTETVLVDEATDFEIEMYYEALRLYWDGKEYVPVEAFTVPSGSSIVKKDNCIYITRGSSAGQPVAIFDGIDFSLYSTLHVVGKSNTANTIASFYVQPYKGGAAVLRNDTTVLTQNVPREMTINAESYNEIGYVVISASRGGSNAVDVEWTRVWLE